MKLKAILKKCLWITLVISLSLLMVQVGRDASKNIWIEGEPTISYYCTLLWEILEDIAAIVPVWLLSLLGLARSFLGENWFPFAEKIPVHTTKAVLAISTILLIVVTIASMVYSEHTEDSIFDQRVIESRFDGWQTVLAWTLFYSLLLFIEQWCLRRNDSRHLIREKQTWVIVTLLLAQMVVSSLGGVKLWYIPLSMVDCPNNLEDYYLWWFSLYNAVSFLPFCFFAARKTVRLFKNNTQWLTLSSFIPKKVTVLIALTSIWFIVEHIQESRYWNNWAEIADLPEYGEAAAMGHTFQALMWGLLLFYAICLLVKQLRAAHRAKHASNT